MRTFLPILCTLIAPLLMVAVGCDRGQLPLPVVHAARAESPHADRPAGRVQFVSGYAEALVEARQSGKPLLVLFSTAKCVYCNQMLKEAFRDESVVRLSEKFVCVRIEADEDQQVCEEFRIEAFPTVQFISSDGALLQRILGKKEPEALASQMEAALQGPHAQTAYRSPISLH